jgi:hypothetical protein
MVPAALISEDYRKMQQELHRNPHYGVASLSYANAIAGLLQHYHVTRLLDYGAGKGRLSLALDELTPALVDIRCYDPAIPEWSEPPEPCEFVACIDVLEHIEPELIDNVLDDLARVTAVAGLFSVHTGPAAKTQTDGRNAHLIQKPAAWWLPKILARFELVTFNRAGDGFYVVVERKAA